MAPELSNLVTYTVSRHLKQPFGEDLKEDDFKYVSSIKEPLCFGYCENNGIEFTEHSKRELVRIYPAGKRVDSSNYNPIIPWSHGCQIGISEIYIWGFNFRDRRNCIGLYGHYKIISFF